MFKQALVQRRPVPDKIKNAPELLPWLGPVYEAFFELVSCRTSEGRIPWDSVFNYASAMGLAQTPSQLASFTELIRAMERRYNEYLKAEHEKAAKQKPKESKSGRP